MAIEGMNNPVAQRKRWDDETEKLEEDKKQLDGATAAV